MTNAVLNFHSPELKTELSAGDGPNYPNLVGRYGHGAQSPQDRVPRAMISDLAAIIMIMAGEGRIIEAPARLSLAEFRSLDRVRASHSGGRRHKLRPRYRER